MRKIGILAVMLALVVMMIAPVAVNAARPAPEVLYYVTDQWGWNAAIEKRLPNGTTEFVWPLDCNQADVSVAKNGSRIAFWSFEIDPNTGEMSWPISVVDLEKSQAYATEISGIPTLSPNGKMMAVTDYIPITVIIDGREWPIGVNEVSIWDISNLAQPQKLYTIPALSREENIQEPSWGPDGSIYLSASDFVVSDASADFYGGIIKYNPKKNARSWIFKQQYAYFFHPEISWDGTSIAYGCYNLSGDLMSSIYVKSLKGHQTSSLGKFVCYSYDFAYGKGQYVYVPRTNYYEEPPWYENYIVPINVQTGQEMGIIAWGSNPEVAEK